MRKYFKTLVAVIMSFALALPSMLSYAGFNDETEMTEVSICKLEVDKLIKDFKLPADKYYGIERKFFDGGFQWVSQAGEQDYVMSTEELKNEMNKDKDDKDKVNSVKTLEGAKFYVFDVGEDVNLSKMMKNKEKYKTVESIIEAVHSGDLDGNSIAAGKDADEENRPEGVPVHTKVFEFQDGLDALVPGKEEPLDSKKIAEIKSKIKSFGVTNSDGLLNMMLEDGSIDYPKNYWIVEDVAGSKPDISGATAVPIALSLPMPAHYDSNTKTFNFKNKDDLKNDEGANIIDKLDHIYVYPKNTTGQDVTKEKTVTDEKTKYASIDNYQNFSWFLQANVKSDDFKNLTYLKFEDTVSPELPDKMSTEEALKITSKTESSQNYLDKGFLFDNRNPVEVYVKKTHPENETEAKKKVKIEQKYYNQKPVSTDGKTLNVEFKSSDVDGKTVLDINAADPHPLFGKEGKPGEFKPTDELTVFVKVNARYSDAKGNIEPRGYEKEADFDRDRKEDQVEITGVGDDALNRMRINSFEVKYSHKPKVELDTEKDSAPGNEYEPRVNTGGKRFLKYAIDYDKKGEDLKQYVGLGKAKFYVKRKRKVSVTESADEGSALGDIENVTERNKIKAEFEEKNKKYLDAKKVETEYLAIDTKAGKKIWIPESHLKKNGLEKVIKTEDEDIAKKYEGVKLYEAESSSEKNTLGLFEVMGLEYSSYLEKYLVYTGEDKAAKAIIVGNVVNEYYLEEFSAPEGYQINSMDINFEIKDGSHVTFDSSAFPVEGTIRTFSMNGSENYKVLGKKTIGGPSGSGSQDLENGDEINVTAVDYSLGIVNHKPIIPETGGIGKLIFIIAGLIIMAVSAILLKKRRSEAQ